MGVRIPELARSDRIAVVLTVASLFLLSAYGITYLFGGDDVNMELQKEDGILENLTALYFIVAGIIFLHLMLSKNAGVKEQYNQYRKLLIILGLLCVFAGLEEISFGQRIIGWESPEYFEDNSTQEETDFHNFPALSLIFGIAAMALIVYGVLVPYAFWKRPDRSSWPAWMVWFRKPLGIQMIYPPVQSALCFLLGILCIFVDAFTKYVLDNQFVANEYQEFLFAFGFLLFPLYLHDARYLKQYSTDEPDGTNNTEVSAEKKDRSEM